ncbi:MAG: 4'-phosphopantetheinyl transferase superfamily protein [Desulfuromonadales bacterium]|nr:4'-phosphopantetheinyl transferase superfamily protein [Desulfuromonadales bacterium]
MLAPGETARAGLLKSEQIKKRYITGRGLLREILGGYLGMEARKVQLAAEAHGKPFLADVKEKLGFNLAHSGNSFLLAVAANREVGVDIETIAPGKPLEEMAKMVFSHHEQEHLSRLSSPCLEAAFYQCWVRKEACLKACGRGFSLPGNSFDISPPNAKTGVMIACCNQKYLQVLDLDVPPRHCAALAVESSRAAEIPPLVIRIDHQLSFN